MVTPQSHERWFRPLLGLICVLTGITGVAFLFVWPVPQTNERELALALGIILGWGSAVVQSEYGSTATGRRLAEKVADAVRTEGE